MDGSGLLFAPLRAALDPAIPVITIAYPPDQALDYAQLERLVRAQLPDDRPYVILGESFSGPIAIAIASSHPPNLVGVLLCCSFARNPFPWMSPLGSLVGWLPVNLAPLALLDVMLLGRYSTTELRAALAKSLAPLVVAAMRARLRAVLQIDVIAHLPEVNVPLWYLQARHDRVVPAHAAQLICRHQPATRVIAMDGPHFLLQTRAAECARVISEFMNLPFADRMAALMPQRGKMLI